MARHDPTAAGGREPAPPPPPHARRSLDEQMLADWAAVGFRKIEAHLAIQAAFCDFLRHRPPGGDEREDPCPDTHAP